VGVVSSKAREDERESIDVANRECGGQEGDSGGQEEGSDEKAGNRFGAGDHANPLHANTTKPIIIG
jgi:hypothetical protein